MSWTAVLNLDGDAGAGPVRAGQGDAEPLRLGIVRKLFLESEEFDHSCGWFGLDRPESSLTHHFKALREAGITRQRQYGLERRSDVRVDDLDARFPGLLDLVTDWTPASR
ncbi:DNA-binding transcriptional ArsR family regulator [Streptomyces sp. TE12347]